MDTPVPLESEDSSAVIQSTVAGLGPSSPAFRDAERSLVRLYDALAGGHALALRFRQWQRSMAQSSAPASEALFLKHTYLATVARLIAFLRVSHGQTTTEAEIEGVLNGEFFEDKAGLPYLVEDDYFTWPLAGDAHTEGLRLAQDLLREVRQCGQAAFTPDGLLALCGSVTGEGSHRGVGGAFPGDANHKFVDVACGAGTGLCTIIQAKKDAYTRAGVDPVDALLLITDSAVGTDTHPLALAVGRVAYLLALGDLLNARRGDLTIPVFLADARHPPTAVDGLHGGVTAYAVEVGDPPVQVYVPESLARDPVGLDYLLPFMKGKYGKAIRNAKTEGMLGRAWYSYHNFLVTPTTSRKPFALTEPEAEVMVQTQRALVERIGPGHDTFWYTMFRNAMRGWW